MPPTKLLSLILSFCLIFEQTAFAQSIDLSHYFVHNSSQAISQSDKFRPLHLRYLGYDNLSQDFKILLDKGDTKKEDLDNKTYIEDNTQTLLKYFFIGLALPNEKFWVNLRPDSPDNILDPDLEKTDIGRIFLEADLQLKKDTASFTSPQNPEGKAYWDKLYKMAGELFGSENITIPTITRPWIVPNEIIIREAPDNAYIYKATLKVMLEEDYLNQKTEKPKNQKTDVYSFSDPRLKELNQYSTQLIKEIIIPKLNYAVNTAKRYAPLRQVYYSLILAQWFKQKYGSSGSIRAPGASAPVNSYIDLIDSGNLSNLTSSQPYDKQAYFQQYQKSFKDGEYNLQEPVYTPMGQSVRRYMSGGMKMDASSSIQAGKIIAGNIFPRWLLKGVNRLKLSVTGPPSAAKIILKEQSTSGQVGALITAIQGTNDDSVRGALAATLTQALTNNPKIKLTLGQAGVLIIAIQGTKDNSSKRALANTLKQALSNNSEIKLTFEQAEILITTIQETEDNSIKIALVYTLEQALTNNPNIKLTSEHVEGLISTIPRIKDDFGMEALAYILKQALTNNPKIKLISEQIGVLITAIQGTGDNSTKIAFASTLKQAFRNSQEMIELTSEQIGVLITAIQGTRDNFKMGILSDTIEPALINNPKIKLTSEQIGVLITAIQRTYDNIGSQYLAPTLQQALTNNPEIELTPEQVGVLITAIQRTNDNSAKISLAHTLKQALTNPKSKLTSDQADSIVIAYLNREEVDATKRQLEYSCAELVKRGDITPERLKRYESWKQASFPFIAVILKDYLSSSDPQQFIQEVKREADSIIATGFNYNNEKELLYAFIGVKKNGIDISWKEFETRMKVIINFDKKYPGHFANLFNKIKKYGLGTIEVNSQEYRQVDASSVKGKVLDQHLEELFEIKKQIDSLKWTKNDFPNQEIFNIKNLYYQLKKKQAEEKGELRQGERFYVKAVSEDEILEAIRQDLKTFYKVVFVLAAKRLGDSNIRDRCLKLMRDLIISDILLDAHLVAQLRSFDIEARITAFKNLYEDYKNHLPDSVGIKISKIRESLGDLSKEVYAEIAKVRVVKGRGQEHYRLIPQGFLSFFRGRAGIIDCSFDPDKGTPYTRAMHENTIYYFVYKGNELKGYIGLMIGKDVSPGQKTLIIDTINSPSLDGEELLGNVFKALDAIAKKLGCIGVALPADLGPSFNFDNKKTIAKIKLYQEAASVKVKPLNEDDWELFTKEFNKDKYNSIDNGGGFKLLFLNATGDGIVAHTAVNPETPNGEIGSLQAEQASSALKEASSGSLNPGGIAFNALPIQTESVVSSALGALPGGRAFRGDLDTEWTRIQDVFNAGIRPSIQRLSEYTVAASASPLAEDKIDQVRVMLADILRRDEESQKLSPAEESCKQLLRLLESG